MSRVSCLQCGIPAPRAPFGTFLIRAFDRRAEDKPDINTMRGRRKKSLRVLPVLSRSDRAVFAFALHLPAKRLYLGSSPEGIILPALRKTALIFRYQRAAQGRKARGGAYPAYGPEFRNLCRYLCRYLY